MLALSKAGSKVLHAKSVELALANNVPLRLLSSFEAGPGTEVKLLPESARPKLAGLTGKAESGRVTLAGRGADAGALSDAVLTLANAGIAVKDGALTENAFSVYVAPEDHRKAMQVLHDEMVLTQYE